MVSIDNILHVVAVYQSPIRKQGFQMSLKFQISFINEDSNENEELRTNPWLVG